MLGNARRIQQRLKLSEIEHDPLSAVLAAQIPYTRQGHVKIVARLIRGFRDRLAPALGFFRSAQPSRSQSDGGSWYS